MHCPVRLADIETGFFTREIPCEDDLRDALVAA